MSIFDELAKIETALSNVTAPDLSKLATADEVTAVSAKLDSLATAVADLQAKVGNPPA